MKSTKPRKILTPEECVKKQFTVARFKKWLDSIESERKFNYDDCKSCVVASFLKEKLKIKNPSVGGFTFNFELAQRSISIPEPIYKLLTYSRERLGNEGSIVFTKEWLLNSGRRLKLWK